MKSLADYEGGGWLPAGWHRVTVTDYKLVQATSGTDGVEFTCVDVGDCPVKTTFWLTDKSLFRLAGFAEACGLAEDERRSYDIEDSKSHRVLINKKVQVSVYKREGKWSDVDDWLSIDKPTPGISPADPRVDRGRQETTDDSPRGPIPF